MRPDSHIRAKVVELHHSSLFDIAETILDLEERVGLLEGELADVQHDLDAERASQ